MNNELNRYLIIFSMCFLVFSCGSSIQKAFVKDDIKKYKVNTITILEFANNNPDRFKKYHPEASEVTRDAIETVFLGFGYNVVERSKLNQVIKEQKLSLTGLTKEDEVKVGKLLNADVVVIGAVTGYMQGQTNTSVVRELYGNDNFGNIIITQFGFSIKGIHVETGVILFSGTFFKELDSITSYKSPVVNLVNEVINKGLVDSLEDKGFKKY